MNMNWKIFLNGRFLGFVRAQSKSAAMSAYETWSGIPSDRLEARAA